MSFALWMILVGIFLPIVTTGLAKWGVAGMDNNHPRVWQEGLTGWRKRADWAHRNHFEALPAFAAAVLVATLVHASRFPVDMIAGLWVAFRVAYTACYISDRATLRSLMWSGGFFCVIALFVVSALAP